MHPNWYRLNSIPVIIRLETRSLCIFKRCKIRNMRNIWVHNVAEMFSEFLHAAKQGEIRISELLLFIFYDSRMSIALLLFFDTRSVYFQTFKQDLQYEKIRVHNVAEILQILQIENLASLSLSRSFHFPAFISMVQSLVTDLNPISFETIRNGTLGQRSDVSSVDRFASVAQLFAKIRFHN